MSSKVSGNKIELMSQQIQIVAVATSTPILSRHMQMQFAIGYVTLRWNLVYTTKTQRKIEENFTGIIFIIYLFCNFIIADFEDRFSLSQAFGKYNSDEVSELRTEKFLIPQRLLLTNL